MTPSADELYARGRELSAQRRYAEAADVLADAAAAATDPDLAARIIGTRAFALTQIGDAETGERTCRAALADERIGAHTRGVLAGQLGSVLVHQGRLDEAIEWLGRAIDTIPDDPLAVANLRVNRSLVHMQRRDLAASFSDLERALAVYTEHGTAADIAETQHNLGYTALLAGDLVRAMREMSAARPVLADLSPANAAISDSDRAEVLRDAGLVTEAERLLEAAATAFGADGMPQARAEAELHLAASLLRHDPARAESVARVAADRFTEVGSASWAARADGIRLRALLSGGAMDRAGRIVADVDDRVDEAEVDGVARRLTGAGFANEATALRLARELWRARTGRPAARMPRVAPTSSLEVRLLAHEVRAARAVRVVGAAAHRGDAPSAAERHAAAGLDELATWQSSFGSLDLQTSVAMHGQGLLLTGIDAAVASARPERVFAWSERARQLSQQVVPLRPPPDPELAADLAELRMLRADLPGADWLSDPRAVALGDRVRHHQWTRTGAADVEERLDLAVVQQRLDADTAVLAYVFGSAGLACLVVTSADAVLVDLPGWAEARAALPGLRADLDMAASVRTGPMSDVIRRSLSGRLADLSLALVEEPLHRAGDRRLVLTTPGVLAGVPWSMLPAFVGRTFTLAPSASRWARTRLRAPRTAGFAAGPRVARGGEEIAVAAAAWDAARRLPAAEATVASVTELARDVDVLHVAAHGRHAADNPLFSGLELADGILFGYDIDQVRPVPRTVVLSACEVGRSSVRWGEEAIGMTRAWMHAGADCVIAAPVVVADDDACELLGAVHEGLAAGTVPAEALAAAQRSTGIVAPFQCHGSGF